MISCVFGGCWSGLYVLFETICKQIENRWMAKNYQLPHEQYIIEVNGWKIYHPKWIKCSDADFGSTPTPSTYSGRYRFVGWDSPLSLGAGCCWLGSTSSFGFNKMFNESSIMTWAVTTSHSYTLVKLLLIIWVFQKLPMYIGIISLSPWNGQIPEHEPTRMTHDCRCSHDFTPSGLVKPRRQNHVLDLWEKKIQIPL